MDDDQLQSLKWGFSLKSINRWNNTNSRPWQHFSQNVMAMSCSRRSKTRLGRPVDSRKRKGVTVKGKNWRRGETSSYSPCKSTRSAVRAGASVRGARGAVFRDIVNVSVWKLDTEHGIRVNKLRNSPPGTTNSSIRYKIKYTRYI